MADIQRFDGMNMTAQGRGRFVKRSDHVAVLAEKDAELAETERNLVLAVTRQADAEQQLAMLRSRIEKLADRMDGRGLDMGAGLVRSLLDPEGEKA